MRLTVLGGVGAWPTPRAGCSGYLLETDGFRLLIDPGYATLPRLQEFRNAHEVDAVLVSHSHPDHCADLNPLLRARALAAEPPPALPLYAPPRALDAVLALDSSSIYAGHHLLREFQPGDRFEIGPFTVDTRLLPHFVPNAGFRLSAAGVSLAYTGDTGPSDRIGELARDVDLLLSEATYPEQVPARDAEFLLSARLAGQYAQRADARRLLLTHLWPGTDPAHAVAAAKATAPAQPVAAALPGLIVDLDRTGRIG